MSVPKLRFKEFDGDWSETSIGKLTKYFKGYAFKSESYKESGRRIIRVSDLGRDSIKYDNDAIFLDEVESSNYKDWMLKKDDIVITTVGSKPHLIDSAVGRPIYIKNNEEGLLNQNLLVLRPINQEVEPYFIFSQLLDNKYLTHIETIQRGNANQSNITVKDLQEFKVFSTSKIEQTQIASFLSAVDEKISQLTQKHELLSQYKQGMMQKLFSQQIRFKADDGNEFGEWEINIIRDVFTNKSKNFNPQSEGNLPCIELEHLSQNTGKILGTIESCKQQSTKNLFEKNSVLFGKLRPYLRKFAKPKFKGVCSSEIWVLTGIKVSNDYLFQYIQSEQFSELTNIQSGSKMPRADWGVISEAEIEYPCLAEQTKIANFLSAIDQKIDVVAQQIEQAKMWKKGLLQQMFV